jgi:hypothetical protein
MSLAQNNDIHEYVRSRMEEHSLILSRLLESQSSQSQPSGALSLSTRRLSVISDIDAKEKSLGGLPTLELEHGINSSMSRALTLNAIRQRVEVFHSCKDWCICRCHKVTRIETPKVLQPALGKGSVQYIGVRGLKPTCDNKRCKKQAATLVQFNYVFPRWLIACILYMTFLYSRRQGPLLTIRTAMVRAPEAQVFHFTRLGNIEGVKMLLSSGQASLVDVTSSWGDNLLHVRFTKK